MGYLERLERERNVLRAALSGLISLNIANRGTPHEYVRCFTFESGPLPAEYRRAIKLLDTEPERPKLPPQPSKERGETKWDKTTT